MQGGKTERQQEPSHFGAQKADRHMLTRIPKARLSETVGEVRERLLGGDGWDTVNYVYVTDVGGVLRGVVSIKELLASAAGKRMSSFVRDPLVVAHPHTPLRVVAGRAIIHSIKAVPVVNHNGLLLGTIGTDTILATMEREHVQDLFSASGIRAKTGRFVDALSAKLTDLVRWRTPWLIAGVFGGMLMAGIVESYHRDLEAAIEIAFFIPLMVYIGAACGSQTQMLFVRGVSYQQINLRQYVLKEITVDLLIAVILSIILGLFALLSTQSMLLARIVSLSVFLIVSTAGIIAIAVSSALLRLHRDPAIGGGPFSTIIQDVVSLLLYLSVASAFLL